MCDLAIQGASGCKKNIEFIKSEPQPQLYFAKPYDNQEWLCHHRCCPKRLIPTMFEPAV